jgi:hypothetical protein
MDLETVLSDPAFDLPIPPDALTRVQRRATGMRRRRRITLALPAVIALVLLPAMAFSGGSDPTSLYGDRDNRAQPAETAFGLGCGALTTKEDFDRTQDVGGGTSVSTWDPIADCAAEYRRFGKVVPTSLKAYYPGHPTIKVIPAGWTPPSTWRLLPRTFVLDARRLELRQRLEDMVDAPTRYGSCATLDQVESFAQAQQRALGLHYLVKRLSRSEAQARSGNNIEGSTICAAAFVDDHGRDLIEVAEVEMPSDLFGPPTPLSNVADRLRAQISDACVGLADAERLARRALTKPRFPNRDIRVVPIRDESRRCTTVDWASIAILLHGPTAPR